MTTLSLSLRSLLLFFFLLASNSSFACLSSNSFQAFAESQSIIVRAMVARHGQSLHGRPGYFEEMTLVVTDVVKGDYPHRFFTFFGGSGLGCLSYVTREQFPIGGEFLFTLQDTKGRQPLSAAGASSIQIREGAVTVRDDFNEYAVPVAEFIELLR